MQMTDKQKLLFKYLNKKVGKTIDAEDLQKSTSYAKSTIQTYIRKKLIREFIEKKECGKYLVLEKIKFYDEQGFQKHFSQISEKCK